MHTISIRSSVVVAILAMAALGGCSSSDSASSPTEASSSGDAVAAAPSEVATTVAVDGAATSVDVCTAVPASKLAPILTGSGEMKAEPGNQNADYSRCNYTVEVSPGFRVPVASIEWYRGTTFFDGQKEMNPSAQAAVGFTDSFVLLDGALVFAKSATGTLVIGKGAELTTGGTSATEAMLVKIAGVASSL